MAELDDYENREQAWVKHWLLERYLEVLILKIGGRWKRFVYIDAFAGPWGSKSEDLSDTSFGRAIRVMRTCKEKLAAQDRSLEMVAAFFEMEPQRAERLKSYANDHSSDGLAIEAHHADFMVHVANVASQLTDNDFAFVLIDPTGYKDIAPSRFAPLLKRRGVEMMINLMWDFINRFWELPQEAEKLDAIFGSDRKKRADVTNLEESASKLFTQRLRAEAGLSGGRLWSSAFPVQHPQKTRTHYFLVYTTHSPLGLDTFGNVVEGTWEQQAQVKARKKVKSAVTIDMFGDDVAGVKAERSVDCEAIHNAWLRRLPVAGSEITVSYELEAELLEECNCLPCDVQAAVRDLVREGILEVCGVSVASIQRRTKNLIQFAKREHVRRIR